MPELLNTAERVFGQYRKQVTSYSAILGDGTGVVSVPNMSGYVYVLTPEGATAKVYNSVAPLINGLPVIVGYDDFNPHLFQVLAVRQSYATPAIAPVLNHHARHEWQNAQGGDDVVFADIRQWMPLRLYAVGLTVGVYLGQIWNSVTSSFQTSPTNLLDLAGLVPATGALYVLISIDATGVLTAAAGTAVPNRSSLSLSDIPTPVDGHTLVAAVVLEAGQTDIIETPTRQDILDLRYPQVSASAVSGSGVDGQVALWNGAHSQTGYAWLTYGVANQSVHIGSTLIPSGYDTGALSITRDAADPTSAYIYMGAAGSKYCGITAYRCNGDFASPAPLVSGDGIFFLSARGYRDTGGWVTSGRARFEAAAAADWLNTSTPTRWDIWTTPTGSVTMRKTAAFEQDGDFYRMTSGSPQKYLYESSANVIGGFAGGYSVTIPATGTVAMLNQANSFTLINPLTTIAESWIGPSSTTGIYFKGGCVGIGTTVPDMPLAFSAAAGDKIQLFRTGNNYKFGFGVQDNGGGQYSTKIFYPSIYTVAGLQIGSISTVDGTTFSPHVTILGNSGNVGIGATVPGAKLTIVGTLDNIQLQVKANATQTTNLQTWETSGGTVLGGVTGNAASNFFVGAAADTRANLYISGSTYTSIAAAGYGTFSKLNVQTADHTAQSYVAVNAQLGLYGTKNYTGGSYGVAGASYFYGSGTLTTLVGFGGTAGYVSGGGTITNLRAVEGTCYAAVGAGTVTNAYNFYGVGHSGGGTFTNAYGLYLASVTAGGTLNYAIYTNAGLNRFGDDVILNGADSDKLWFGAGKDMSLYYDGTSGFIKTDEVAASDLHITCGAAKTLVLDTVVYQDINIAGALLSKPASSAPGTDTFRSTGGTDTTIETYAFAVDEKVHGGFELQHDYKEGTDLVFHVHWQGIAAPTGTDNVQWRLNYIVARDGVTLAAAVVFDSPDTAIDTQYRCYRTDFAAITGTNFKIGDQFMFTLTRVASTGDAYAGDALIETAGIHYQIDTLGSRSISAK